MLRFNVLTPCFNQIKRKALKAAKLFGLSDDQFKQAIDNAKIEYETGVAPPAPYDNIATLSSIVNYLMIIGMVVALIWAINRDYDNAAIKLFVANFPREAKFCGVKWPEKDYATQNNNVYTANSENVIGMA